MGSTRSLGSDLIWVYGFVGFRVFGLRISGSFWFETLAAIRVLGLGFWEGLRFENPRCPPPTLRKQRQVIQDVVLHVQSQRICQMWVPASIQSFQILGV